MHLLSAETETVIFLFLLWPVFLTIEGRKKRHKEAFLEKERYPQLWLRVRQTYGTHSLRDLRSSARPWFFLLSLCLTDDVTTF